MELQFQESGIRTLKEMLSDIRNMELTQEIRLPDSMPDIGRVLTAWGQVQLRTKEWNRDDIQVSGGVSVWVLYLPEDGTEPRSVEGWIPFQMRWEMEPGREGIIRFSPLLRFVDGRGISARKMMVRAGLGAAMEALGRNETKVYTPGDIPENVELLQRTYPLRIPKEAGERVFRLDEDLDLPDTLPAPEKILSFTLNPIITEKKVLGDRLVFKGKGNLHLVYRCQEGKVHSGELELPFSQFADLDGTCSQEGTAEVWPVVTNLEADMPQSGKLRLKAGLVGQYLVEDQVLAEITEDAYSPFRALEQQVTTLALPTVLETRTESVCAEQILTGESGRIADIWFLPDFPRQRSGNQGVDFELPGLFQVLFYGPDGSLQSGTARWEGSFSLRADDKTRIGAMMMPVGSPTAVSGESIGLSAQLRLQLRSRAETELPMVTGLELGEHRQPDPGRPSLILCRPGGEELWDIAKRCGSTVAAIRQANGLQPDELPERMLLIPVR